MTRYFKYLISYINFLLVKKHMKVYLFLYHLFQFYFIIPYKNKIKMTHQILTGRKLLFLQFN